MPAPLPPLQPLDSALKIGERLGAGAMGAVFRAQELATGRQIALKVLNADSKSATQRFVREGEVTAGLSDPRIVKVHGIGTLGGKPCLSYELVEGARTFEEASEAEPETAIPLLIEASKALGVAHAAGLTHRDVKSENLLVDSSGRIKVTDFGLVTGEELDRLTRSGAWVGTPNTMAPEQFGAREEVGPTTDVWALGVLLYRVLTGLYPFQGAESMLEMASAITRGGYVRPSRVRTVPPALEAVCLKALELKPQDRYPDGASFGAALEAAAQDPGRSEDRGRRVSSVLAGVGVLGIVALGIGFQVRAEARRERAQQELFARLEPREAASARFAGLGLDLESLGDDLDRSSGDALFAAGLASVGRDEEGEAGVALGKLRALPNENLRTSALEACCDARWGRSQPELKAALRRLRLKSVSGFLEGFADVHLLSGRALTLSGDPVAGLDALARVPGALSDEPWRSLALRSAALAGARGKLSPRIVGVLAEGLPEESARLLSLSEWAEAVRLPRIPVLVKLLEKGEVPPEFRSRLRELASRELGVARMPLKPTGASALAGNSFWSQPILGLEVRSELPVAAEVYEILADWTRVAGELELERADELYEVARGALRALDSKSSVEHVQQRQRLFEAYLHFSPTPALVGVYGLAALNLGGERGQRALTTLRALTAEAPQPQRGFWLLWLAYVEIRHGVYAFSAPSLAEQEASRSKLKESEEWVRAAVRDPSTLATLRADVAVREVLAPMSDLLAIFLLGMARANVAVGEPYASLEFFRLLKTRKSSIEPWESEYVLALLAAQLSPRTPSAAKAELERTFEGELLHVLDLVHSSYRHALVRAAWNGRALISESACPKIVDAIKKCLRVAESGAGQLRVRAAWFALGAGREEEARKHLAVALRHQDEGDLRREIQALRQGTLTQAKIEELDKALILRAAPIRRD